MHKILVYLVIFGLCLLTGCIDEIDVDIEPIEDKSLVVEAFLFVDENGKMSFPIIELSYDINFDNDDVNTQSLDLIDSNIFNAEVYVVSSNGDTIKAVNELVSIFSFPTSDGPVIDTTFWPNNYFRLEDSTLTIGESYQLIIQLANGLQYESSFQEAFPPVKKDTSMQWSFNEMVDQAIGFIGDDIEDQSSFSVISFNDPLFHRNGYLLTSDALRLQQGSYWPVFPIFDWLRESRVITEEDFENGSEVLPNIAWGRVQSGLQLFSINSNFVDYFSALRALYLDRGPFASQTFTPQSNIRCINDDSKSVLGFFEIMTYNYN